MMIETVGPFIIGNTDNYDKSTRFTKKQVEIIEDIREFFRIGKKLSNDFNQEIISNKTKIDVLNILCHMYNIFPMNNYISFTIFKDDYVLFKHFPKFTEIQGGYGNKEIIHPYSLMEKTIYDYIDIDKIYYDIYNSTTIEDIEKILQVFK